MCKTTFGGSMSNSEKPESSSRGKKALIKKCPACGGIDHQRRTSKNANITITRQRVIVIITIQRIQVMQLLLLLLLPFLVSTNSNNASHITNISEPSFINVGNNKSTYTPVIDVSSDKFTPTPTTFRTYQKNYRERVKSVPQLPLF